VKPPPLKLELGAVEQVCADARSPVYALIVARDLDFRALMTLLAAAPSDHPSARHRAAKPSSPISGVEQIHAGDDDDRRDLY
jgi:hypothetical protein